MRIAPIVVAGALLAQAPPVYRGKDEKLPRQVAPQPIAFSHKQHAAAKLRCADCHPGAAAEERAGLPAAARCLACHRTILPDHAEVRKLFEYEKRGGRIPWVRVYEVPEFVFFSHAGHTGADIGCETCHGPVEERDVLAQEVSTSMTACMSCHAAREVSNDCHFCHALGF